MKRGMAVEVAVEIAAKAEPKTWQQNDLLVSWGLGNTPALQDNAGFPEMGAIKAFDGGSGNPTQDRSLPGGACTCCVFRQINSSGIAY